MSDLFNEFSSLIKQRADRLAKLTKTSSTLEDFDETIRAQLKQMYGSKENTMLMLATLINSVVSERKLTFLISRRTFYSLLDGDEHHELSSPRDETWGDFCELLVQWKFIEVLRPYTSTKASVWKVVHPQLCSSVEKLITADLLKAQEQAVLELYDNDKTEQVEVPVQPTPVQPVLPQKDAGTALWSMFETNMPKLITKYGPSFGPYLQKALHGRDENVARLALRDLGITI